MAKDGLAFALPDANVCQLGGILQRKGYKVFLRDGGLYAFKGLAGKLGPIGVHAAMLLIMAGALAAQCFMSASRKMHATFWMLLLHTTEAMPLQQGSACVVRHARPLSMARCRPMSSPDCMKSQHLLVAECL